MNTINNRIINKFQSGSKHMKCYNKEALEKYEVENKDVHRQNSFRGLTKIGQDSQMVATKKFSPL